MWWSFISSHRSSMCSSSGSILYASSRSFVEKAVMAL